MRTTKFRQLLDSHNALRVQFEVSRGQVERFMVQFEARFNDHWTPVVRFDSAHGFAHCDLIHPYEPTTKRRMCTQDYNEALTFAIQELSSNWNQYRERYEKWLKQI